MPLPGTTPAIAARVRIAVIDGGFQGYTALLGTDLPASVVTQNFASTGDIGGGTPHGTACAEIVYDMAPQASLYLLRIATALDLQRAVTFAIENGIQVISTSLGFYNVAPGDGTGFLANEVARARNAEITWVTAAGNERQRHWGGIFADADSDDVHEFASGVEINCIALAPGGECAAIPAGYVLRAFLRWDNWTPPVNQDYDLAIVRWNGSAWQSVSIGGDNYQNGGANQQPTEGALAQTSGAATAYGVVIMRYQATRTYVQPVCVWRACPTSERSPAEPGRPRRLARGDHRGRAGCAQPLPPGAVQLGRANQWPGRHAQRRLDQTGSGGVCQC